MNAWIQTVLNEAATIETERYDTKALNVSINQSLTGFERKELSR